MYWYNIIIYQEYLYSYRTSHRYHRSHDLFRRLKRTSTREKRKTQKFYEYLYNIIIEYDMLKFDCFIIYIYFKNP